MSQQQVEWTGHRGREGTPGQPSLESSQGKVPVPCVSQGTEAGQGEGAPGRGGNTTPRHPRHRGVGCVTSPAGNGDRGKGTGVRVAGGRTGPLPSPQPARGALGTQLLSGPRLLLSVRHSRDRPATWPSSSPVPVLSRSRPHAKAFCLSAPRRLLAAASDGDDWATRPLAGSCVDASSLLSSGPPRQGACALLPEPPRKPCLPRHLHGPGLSACPQGCRSAFCCVSPARPPARPPSPLGLWLLITSSGSPAMSPLICIGTSLSCACFTNLSSERGLGFPPHFPVCFCPWDFGHVTVPSPQCSDPSQLWSEGKVVAGTHGWGAVRGVGAMGYPEMSERDGPLAPSPGCRTPRSFPAAWMELWADMT